MLGTVERLVPTSRWYHKNLTDGAWVGKFLPAFQQDQGNSTLDAFGNPRPLALLKLWSYAGVLGPYVEMSPTERPASIAAYYLSPTRYYSRFSFL